MKKAANISIQIDDSLKNEAEEILKTLGLTASHAIKIFYSQIVLSQGLPFGVVIPQKSPNETTLKAMAEQDLATFETPQVLFEDLGIQ